jgi:hypothetical protein
MKAAAAVCAVLSICALSLAPLVRAAAETPPPPNRNWVYGKYAPDSLAYVFGTDVPLRAAPSPTARTVQLLSNADPPVTILKQEEATYRSTDGYRDYWYRVRLNTSGEGAAVVEGYVWGGSLAKAVVDDDLDGDGDPERVLIGVYAPKRASGKETGALANRLAEARVVKAGKVIGSVAFPTIEMPDSDRFAYTLTADALGGKGLGSGARVLRVGFEYEACDYPNGQVYLVWSGGRLRNVLKTEQSSHETGSYEEKAIFPGDKGGRPGQVTIVETLSTTPDDKPEAKLTTKITRRVLRWDGRTFVPTKVTAARRR